jgi:phospholipase/carboxylesterase
VTEAGFVHSFDPAKEPGAPTLILLHGTGGDENDLLPLGRMLDERAALLSPRGKVLENGMPRFFRRLSMGVFDEEDLVNRTHELASFVEEAASEYGLDPKRLFAVGFSNGANIAAAVLQLRPEALAGAALLRAMVPLQDPPAADLSGKPVLILSGASDPIVPAEYAKRLASLLTGAGASVQHQVLPTGHGLTQTDVALTKTWIDQL